VGPVLEPCAGNMLRPKQGRRQAKVSDPSGREERERPPPRKNQARARCRRRLRHGRTGPEQDWPVDPQTGSALESYRDADRPPGLDRPRLGLLQIVGDSSLQGGNLG
jgi:hypothetical protein